MSTRKLPFLFDLTSAVLPADLLAQVYIIDFGPPSFGRYDGIGRETDAARFASRSGLCICAAKSCVGAGLLRGDRLFLADRRAWLGECLSITRGCRADGTVHLQSAREGLPASPVVPQCLRRARTRPERAGVGMGKEPGGRREKGIGAVREAFEHLLGGAQLLHYSLASHSMIRSARNSTCFGTGMPNV